MELGGAESALLGLLQSVDPDRIDVDVFIYDHRGELMDFIPRNKVRLLPEILAYKMIERPIGECVKYGQIGVAIGRLWAKKTVNRDSVQEGKDDIRLFARIADCVERFVPMIQPNIEYDLAISFLVPHNYVLSKVYSKKKVGWIHTDYTRIHIDVEAELKIWERLDQIVCISEEVGNRFCEVFPSLKNKLILIENILNTSFIRKRSNEASVTLCDDSSVTNLLTIGRFSPPKKMEEIPLICKKILEQGLSIKWYIIGYGSEEIERIVRDNAEKERVADKVVILGKKENPYPYINACDIYVQPSRYEGKSITVREAQILCKPVIITNYPTARSQVMDGVDGIIVPMDVNECATQMAEFISNKEKQHEMIHYLETHDYGNENEVNKIYDLLR